MGKYYVRNFPLHLEKSINNKKTTQVFEPGELIEITDEEAAKYKHLIETEAQYKSRQKEKKAT